jgi:hypothetical protein
MKDFTNLFQYQQTFTLAFLILFACAFLNYCFDPIEVGIVNEGDFLQLELCRFCRLCPGLFQLFP